MSGDQSEQTESKEECLDRYLIQIIKGFLMKANARERWIRRRAQHLRSEVLEFVNFPVM